VTIAFKKEDHLLVGKVPCYHTFLKSEEQ